MTPIVKGFSFCFLVSWLVLAIGGCTPEVEPAQIREVHVFNWEDYFAPDTLENFEKESGIRVSLDTFGSEEEMFAGLQSQPGRYDVVIASEGMVWTLRQLKLLSPLDLKRIPNFANIQEHFRDLPSDPKNRYSVPYLWGTTGLVINTSYLPEDTDTWEVLWSPAYQGRIALLNDPQEVLGVALLTLGHSLNSRDAQHLEAAKESLLEQKPLLAGYLDPITIMEMLISEELWAAQLYSGDAMRAAENNPNLIYIVPREGAALWVDNLVIPAGVPHRQEAEIFINYFLRPEVAGATVNYLRYASPNQAAGAYTEPEIREDPSIYLDSEILSQLEYYQPLDEETNQRLNRIWTELLNP